VKAVKELPAEVAAKASVDLNLSPKHRSGLANTFGMAAAALRYVLRFYS
jgi:hypothetical protein